MLNMDFTQTVIIDTQAQEWLPGPDSGGWHKPLAIEPRDKGHATSMVRYDRGARFAPHDPMGEEIFVLDGTLSDEYGDFPAGSYIRNPPGFSHRSYSDEGCLLFTKLHQFQPEDRQQIHIDTRTTPSYPGLGKLRIMPLHEFKAEHTALVFWPAGHQPNNTGDWGGEEMLVVSGQLRDQRSCYPPGTWLRGPRLSHHLQEVEQDTVVWLKTGHLAPL